MKSIKNLTLLGVLLLPVSLSYAGEPADIGSTKETPQTDGSTIKSTVNHDGTVTVKHVGKDGKVISSKKVKPGGGANVYDPNGDCAKDPTKLC
jgi:hypothetical protein